MAADLIGRRRFLAAGGAAVVAVAAVGVSRLLGSGDDPSAAGSSAAATSTDPPQTVSTTTSTQPSTTAAPESTSTTTTTTAAAADSIVVICREAWGAQPVSGEFTPHTIRRITVHHTAVLLESNRSAPSRARQHQGYHQSLGWPDLAYHYLIDANGHIYEGRPTSAVGDTATDYDPTGHLLICCEGDFNQQEVPLAQYQSLLAVLAWGANQFGVAPDTIQGHRDLAATTCPGDHLYSFLEDRRLRDDVVATAVRELVVLCDETATELVTAIEAGTA